MVRQIAIYLSVFLAVVLAANFTVYKLYEYKDRNTLASAGVLARKVPYYLQNAGSFDALFLGDSRTLCAMHPDLLEPYWGLKAFNLAHWAIWFPNQYALIRDIVTEIPKDTVVVWSIGYQNFQHDGVTDVYPPGWAGGTHLVRMGFALPDVLGAQLAHEPLSYMISRRSNLFEFVQQQMKKPVVTFGETGTASEEKSSVLKSYEQAEGTAFIKPWYDEEGTLVSVAQYKTNGAYMRTEIVPAYYRDKQTIEEVGEALYGEEPNPKSWVLFTGMLALFKQHDIKLIVNEFEEAPFRYVDEEKKNTIRAFMRERVRKTVESYGFQYIRVDFDQLSTPDYFDFNHLNKDGVEKFSAMLGPELSEAKDAF